MVPETSPPVSLQQRLLEPRTQAIAFAVLASFIVFARLGQGHLANFDDCYYAEKAKEMVRHGSWLTPRFAGVPRWDNPPLFLWLMAGSFQVFGITDYGAIFVSALSGVACVVALFHLAARLGLDPFERWAAAFVLLTTQYFLKYARHAMFDVFLTLLFVLAIDAYTRALLGERRRLLALGLLCGLGVLTKSVLGLFPLAVAALHVLATGRARLLISPWFLGAAFLALATAVPWYAYSYARHGEPFIREHFQWLLWERAFVIGREHQGWGDRLGYLKDLAKHYWPWLPLAVAGLVVEARAFARARAGAPARAAASVGLAGTPSSDASGATGVLVPRDRALLLGFWLLVVVGTMSLAIEKKLWYVMSAFPCLAILAARGAGAWIPGERARRRLVLGGFALLAVVGTILTLTPFGLRYERNPDLIRMALVTREMVPEGQKVLNLDAPYWRLANQFLFYSDRDLTGPLEDPALVRSGLARGEYALLTTAAYQAVAGPDSVAYPIVAASGSWRLVKAAPPAPALLPPSDPYP